MILSILLSLIGLATLGYFAKDALKAKRKYGVTSYSYQASFGGTMCGLALLLWGILSLIKVVMQ